MTDNELYISFLKEKNDGVSRQQDITDRMATPEGIERLVTLATDLKEVKALSNGSLKKQIERACKVLNIDKLTLHVNKKGEKCSISAPYVKSGGQDALTNWLSKYEAMFEKYASPENLVTRQEFVSKMIEENEILAAAYEEKERLAA